MPKCRACGEAFPCSIVIDGKRRNLNNRKRCLKCSPFGSHNTSRVRKLGQVAPLGKEKVPCKTCNKLFLRRTSNRSRECNTCSSRRRRAKVQRKLIEYAGRACTVCGYSKSLRSLSFHHINPETKKFNVSGNYSRSWEALKAEAEKCILVCANCHAEIEDGLLDASLYTASREMRSRETLWKESEADGHICEACGNPATGRRCVKCYGLSRRKVVRPGSEELAALIATKPMTTIGAMYGVSDNAVRKWAIAYGISLL